MKKAITLLIFFSAAVPLAAQQALKPADWSAWNFLVGDWISTSGGGAPGQATAGGFTFSFDLQKRLLVRRSFSEFPATDDMPAYRHDDLMVVFQDEAGKTRAVYFDNEGHVIHYGVSFSADGGTVTFTSDAAVPGPRFRFIYRKLGTGEIDMEFDIAPPGQPEAFSKYVGGTAKRK